MALVFLRFWVQPLTIHSSPNAWEATLTLVSFTPEKLLDLKDSSVDTSWVIPVHEYVQYAL